MKPVAFASTMLLALGLVGCSLTQSSICVDYIGPLTPAEAGTEAGLVVLGTVAEAAGSRTIYGEVAPVHRVTVDSVLKGELPAGTTQIDVAALPQTCNGEGVGAYPEGDPLDVDGRVELFLFVDDGEYTTLTPWDGVLAAPIGEPLPWVPED